MRLTDEAYDRLKQFMFLIFPSLTSLLFIASYIWELPSTKVITGYVSIISLIIGVGLSISTKRYKESNAAYDGKLFVVIPEDGPKVFSLELNGDPDELAQQDSVTFKILPQ